MRGKSVNLYFMEGDSRGRVKCTVPNWTDAVYRIPRTELEKCRGAPASIGDAARILAQGGGEAVSEAGEVTV